VTVSGRGLGRAGRRALTALEFQGLAAVPLEAEWFANIDNPRTRRAYRIDLREFMGFVGIGRPAEFRKVTRAHVLAWRKDLEGRELSGPTVRRKLAALSSLFEHLCDANAVTHNPVKRGCAPRWRATRARRRPWATGRRGPYSMRRE
jgi:site-specific recombinase XerD